MRTNVERLNDTVAACQSFSTSIYAEVDDSILEARITLDKQTRLVRSLLEGWAVSYRSTVKEFESDTIAGAFSQIGKWLSAAAPFPETVIMEHAGSSLALEDLYNLAHAAWCEALKCPPSSTPIDSESGRKHREEIMRAKLWPKLIGGESGIAAWNNVAHAATEVDWKGSQLTGLQLQRVQLGRLDFSNSTFEGANLDRARLGMAQLNHATFRGASMVAASLPYAKLCNAILVDTNLSDSDCTLTDLRGADLSGAVVTGAKFAGAQYDETTVLPANFPQWSDLSWVGSGPDAYMLAQKQGLSQRSINNFDQFMALLLATFGRTRMENARKMLVKDRCLVFAEVTENGVIGVVRSHLEPDVAYGCHLGIAGQYSCITQKLTPCKNLKDTQWHAKRAKETGELGVGLRVAPCKHLMVLFITLAQTNKMDLPLLSKAVLDTIDRKPVLAKALVTKILLKYQSAQTGALDWRPPESVPEDYYSV